QSQRERAPAGGRIELSLAAVPRPLYLDDVAGVDELLEHARQRLFGDLEHVKQFRDCQAGATVYEVQNPVVGATEAVVHENLVRIGREIPVGEEQQFDQGEIDPVFVRSEERRVGQARTSQRARWRVEDGS